MILPSTAFADDDMSLLTEQGQLSADPVTVNDTEPFSVSDKDAILHQYADKIAFDLEQSGLLSESGTKAQDYVYSIYLYLQNSIYPQLSAINSSTASIATSNTNISSDTTKILKVLYGNNSTMPSQGIHTMIDIMLDTLNTPYTSGTTSPGVLGNLILMNDKLSTASGVSVATSAANIADALGASNTTLSTISSRINTTNSRLNTVNTNLNTINTSVRELNNMSWTDITSYFEYIGCSFDIEDAFTNHVITSPDVYFKIAPSQNIGGNVIRIRLPFVFGNFSIYNKVKVYYKTGVDEYDNDIYIEVPTLSIVNNGQQIYLYNLPNQAFKNNFIIRLSNEYQDITTSTSSTLFKVEYIGQDIAQSWLLRQSLATSNIERMILNIKDEIASDNMVNAKKESKEVIDDTLENFTGSGSAAAKKSDTQAMKDISGSLKSGLDGGGSVSNAISVFNSNNGIWEWFTQNNYNDINNPSLEQRKTRSDFVPDFYNNNQFDLRNLLGGDR